MTNLPDIAACPDPKCGGECILDSGGSHGGLVEFDFVRCIKCNYQGPEQDDDLAAIEASNRIAGRQDRSPKGKRGRE